jgi:hypothetical protein
MLSFLWLMIRHFTLISGISGRKGSGKVKESLMQKLISSFAALAALA